LLPFFRTDWESFMKTPFERKHDPGILGMDEIAS
jgi:hypothetical protein